MHPIDDRTWPNKTEENKSWNEFMEWADEEWPYANVLHKFVYDRLLDYEKIGLLIEFLKTKQPEHEKLHWIDIRYLTVDNLEELVKSLKPKEVQEIHIVEKVISDMWRHGDSWKDIAKKAIEIIKGNK